MPPRVTRALIVVVLATAAGMVAVRRLRTDRVPHLPGTWTPV